MKIKIITFAQTRTQLGFDERVVDCEPSDTPRIILQRLAPKFENLAGKPAFVMTGDA